jgi:hypothetical protein
MAPISPDQDLRRILESADRLGVEIDEEEALQWLAAMAASKSDEIGVDEQHGIYGQKITLLDFAPADLAYFRALGRIVEIPDRPGQVETALALSGSAAQSKIQTHPGDCDFFERVNILAPNRAEACRLLADLLKDKILSTANGPTYRFMEAKFGCYPFDAMRDGKPVKKGGPIAWSLIEVRAGMAWINSKEGQSLPLEWFAVAEDPGWCKLDWVVADPPRSQLSNASNNLDVTWESPDGEITPLDGQLDPYFQEVYLDAASIPIFTKLARHVAADAMDTYVEQLLHEVRKYTGAHPNYGKAAKRLYNIFRLSGRYNEAAYLRELFDEPATVLYQIAALIRTVDEASGPDSQISAQTIAAQLDELIIQAVEVLEGPQETQIVRRLLRLRSMLASPEQERAEEVDAAQADVMEVVNQFFYQRLQALPAIRAYLESLRAEGSAQ